MNTNTNPTHQFSALELYPYVAEWIEENGIEISYQFNRGIIASAYDEGGTIWEGDKYQDFDAALEALNQGIAEWIEENMD